MKHRPTSDMTHKELMAELLTPDGKGRAYKSKCLSTLLESAMSE